jgi:putative transposase
LVAGVTTFCQQILQRCVVEHDVGQKLFKSRRTGQAGLEQRVKEICQTRVRYGYRRVYVLLRRDGWRINQKKTRRI